MLEKTEGVVLHTIKHSDSGIISHIFTKKHGRLSFMIKGLSSRKGITRRAYFQPLQALSLEFYYRENRDLQIIKEATPLFNYVNLHDDIRKCSMMIFLGEVLYKALRPAGADEHLYQYLIESFDYLDRDDSLTPNFHIGFIIGLTRYLGIAPSNNYSGRQPYFDMQNGSYTSDPPLHGFYMDREYSSLLNNFLKSNISECSNILLSGNTRKEFLNDMLGFYSLHLPGFKNIQSLKVYSEIFNPVN
ncbi:MAG: DNA repair protein RecO [Bacteroidota bacterium]